MVLKYGIFSGLKTGLLTTLPFTEEIKYSLFTKCIEELTPS